MRQIMLKMQFKIAAMLLVAGVLFPVASSVHAAPWLESWLHPPCKAPPAYPPADPVFPPGMVEQGPLMGPDYAGGPCGGATCHCGTCIGGEGPCCPSDMFALTDGLGGVIDNAVVRDRVRIRYDHLKGVNAGDRAEYLFGAPEALGGPAGTTLGNVKLQEITTYVEWKFHRQLSVFGEFPIRLVDNAIGRLDEVLETVQTHNAGAGDVRAGLRYALLQQPHSYLTAQVKVFIPTGDASRFLGTGHPAIEAGVLFQHQWDRLTVFGEILDWQASAGSVVSQPAVHAGDRFSGNVLRYSIGAGYDLGRRIDCQRLSRLTFLSELVCWTVLDGFKSDEVFVNNPDGPSQYEHVAADASGDTIINGIFGLRYTVGCNTFYIGYGTDWSVQRWHSDQVRMEFGHNF